MKPSNSMDVASGVKRYLETRDVRSAAKAAGCELLESTLCDFLQICRKDSTELSITNLKALLAANHAQKNHSALRSVFTQVGGNSDGTGSISVKSLKDACCFFDIDIDWTALNALATPLNEAQQAAGGGVLSRLTFTQFFLLLRRKRAFNSLLSVNGFKGRGGAGRGPNEVPADRAGRSILALSTYSLYYPEKCQMLPPALKVLTPKAATRLITSAPGGGGGGQSKPSHQRAVTAKPNVQMASLAPPLRSILIDDVVKCVVSGEGYTEGDVGSVVDVPENGTAVNVEFDHDTILDISDLSRGATSTLVPISDLRILGGCGGATAKEATDDTPLNQLCIEALARVNGTSCIRPAQQRTQNSAKPFRRKHHWAAYLTEAYPMPTPPRKTQQQRREATFKLGCDGNYATTLAERGVYRADREGDRPVGYKSLMQEVTVLRKQLHLSARQVQERDKRIEQLKRRKAPVLRKKRGAAVGGGRPFKGTRERTFDIDQVQDESLLSAEPFYPTAPRIPMAAVPSDPIGVD